MKVLKHFPDTYIYFIGILDYRHFSKVDSFSGFTVIIADAMNIVDNGN